jgi:hypothetical protein
MTKDKEIEEYLRNENIVRENYLNDLDYIDMVNMIKRAIQKSRDIEKKKIEELRDEIKTLKLMVKFLEERLEKKTG